MAKKTNRYAKKAQKQDLLKILKGTAATKGAIGASALMGIKDIALVVLGGGIIAAVSGKVALPVGFVITGAGYYIDNKILQLIGAGTMAAHNFQKAGTVQGLEGLEGVKERLQAYKESLKERFFIDQLLKKKSGTNGVGELHYFNQSDGMNGDLAALDDIESQLAESALQFQGNIGGEADYLLGDMGDVMY